MSQPLQNYWNTAGIKEGDLVLIHSSMRRTFRQLLELGFQPDPRFIIESLREQVGIFGTVIFPLFNFDFPELKSFSMLSTKSQMGKITEIFRTQYPIVRTGHPIYSFGVIGNLEDEFKNIDNLSGYGSDSPFAKLHELDGKIAVVDLEDQESMTSYHYVEEFCNVPYRYFKDFQGEYESIDGSKSIKNYKLFVRDLNQKVYTSVNRMGEILWREGLYFGNRPGKGNGMRTIKMRDLFARTKREIEEGRAIETLYQLGR